MQWFKEQAASFWVWAHQVLLAIDQVLNAMLWGYADETLSARAWRCRDVKRRWAVAVWCINKLFFWQDNHCRGAYAHEVQRKQLPPYYSRGG